MTFKCLAVGFVAALGFVTPAMSASLTIQSIDGDWQNASPNVRGEGTSEIRWGTNVGYGQSGYRFDASADMNVLDEMPFVLGTFTHMNIPIRPSLLSSVELAVQFMVEGVVAPITSVFSFDHWETHNEARSCANGGARGVGLNVNGCADRVTATLNEGKSESFVIEGVEYVLDISGFQYDGDLMTDFWTVERRTNDALLLASFRVVPSEVPLPTSGLLLLGGVAGLAMARRRRK